MNREQSTRPDISVELHSPSAQGVRAMRDFLVRMREVDPVMLTDEQLIDAFNGARLCAAPLLGRKVAISGSAQLSYRTGSDGKPILGIGDAIAEGMLFWGADVVVNSFTPSMDENRLKFLRTGFGPRRCEYVQADMSTEDGARSFVSRAKEALGGVDVLVLNAGTYGEPDLKSVTNEHFTRTFNLNTAGPIWAVQEYLRLVGPSVERGRIVITSSINAQLSETNHAIYDMSKAALEGFIRSAALQIAKERLDVRINGVAPGLLTTPLTHDAINNDPAERKRLDSAIPLGLGRPYDLAMPYMMLALAGNNYMTGTVLDVSGGLRVSQSTEVYDL